jgi:transketolase C-terminal domain/subunit
MKNKLSDLNNHLFAEIERLGDEDLKGEELAREIGRAKAVCDVAATIVANGRLVLDAARAADQLPNVRKQTLLLE